MVRPPRAIVSAGVAPLRAQPDDAAELVDQASYGEHMTALALSGERTYVQGPDLYFGWIRTASLTPYGTPHAVFASVPPALVLFLHTSNYQVLCPLPADAPFKIIKSHWDRAL